MDFVNGEKTLGRTNNFTFNENEWNIGSWLRGNSRTFNGLIGGIRVAKKAIYLDDFIPSTDPFKIV